MGSFTDAQENKILDHQFKNTAYTQPTNIDVALYINGSGPGEAGGGTEVTGTGYARVTHNTWDAAAGGATENTGIIDFGTAGAGGWGVVGHFALFDGANMICYGDLTISKTIDEGDTVQFADGAIDITLD